MSLTEDDKIIKNRAHRLFQALSASLVINLVLSLFCIYEWHESGYSLLKKLEFQPQEVAACQAVEPSFSLQEALAALADKPISELIHELRDESIVVDGYQARDLALGCLYSHHHFDVQKVLTGALKPKQERQIQGKDKIVTLFPALSNEHFLALSRFAEEERFPFTAEGLFCSLKQNSQDLSLQSAFSQTKEYMAIDQLFRRSGDAIAREQLMEMVLSGTWKMIADLKEKAKGHEDFSRKGRQEVLLSYVLCSSKVAAEVLILKDPEFAKHKLDDQATIMLLGLLEEHPSLCQEYALALLESPRKDEVWRSATEKLLAVSEKLKHAEKSYSRAEILALFGKKVKGVVVAEAVATGKTLSKQAIPQISKQTSKKAEKQIAKAIPKSTPKATSKPGKPKAKERMYVVQSGDNLWRISRKFHVEIKEIRLANNLQSDALKPGSVLRIPS